MQLAFPWQYVRGGATVAAIVLYWESRVLAGHLLLQPAYSPACCVGMWRDGILSQPGNTTSGNTSQVYTLTQNPGVFASNFIPLWAGLTEGNESQGAQVVAALKNSSLIGPSGGWVDALYI